MTFKPHSLKQNKVVFGEKPITIAATGIQWGKTESAVVWLRRMITRYTDPRDNFLVTAPTYPIMAQSTMPAFNNWFEGLGTHDKKENCFKIHNGGTVWFRTGVHPNSVVGITRVRAIVCDEAGLYSLLFWETIQGRASFSESPIRIVTSPYSLNWLHKDYILPYNKKDPNILAEVDLIQATSKENPYFPDREYERKRKTMDARRFNMQYGGRFDRAEGLVYNCWDDDAGIVHPFELPPGTKFVAGVDWGYVHPFALTVRAYTKDGRHYQVMEFKKAGMTIDRMVDVAKSAMTQFPIQCFFCDPARPEYIDTFNTHGITSIAADNAIRTGIDKHYELIKTGRYQIFHGHHKHTVDEMEKYHYPEYSESGVNKDEKDPNPVKQDDDILDANRYATMGALAFANNKNSSNNDQSKSELEKIKELMRPKNTNLEVFY